MGKFKRKLMPKASDPTSKVIRIDPHGDYPVPKMFIPSFRTAYALNRGVAENLLLFASGGLGDQVCAEPSFRYALREFKNCRISLAAPEPEIFSHLKFENVFDLKYQEPDYDEFFVFRSLYTPNHLQWEFMSHLLCQAVDYSAMNMFRGQLPVADREINLFPSAPQPHIEAQLPEGPWVLVHPGRGWPSKTFPSDWWNEVLRIICVEGAIPVLVGANVAENRGTVDVRTEGCVDLRNQTSVNDMMWLCKNAPVLLTNDSSPLHMAAAGDAWIGFLATCKRADFITHWRQQMWGWRMKNFARGGIWELQDLCPNHTKKMDVDVIDEETLRSWLPEPKEIAGWASEKAYEQFSRKVDK